MESGWIVAIALVIAGWLLVAVIGIVRVASRQLDRDVEPDGDPERALDADSDVD
ncbi:hypothetical protein [Microbacterium sp.]|uniref:hypothetical protein n=1 Tax=unclassified Microbacterium TaxID=2609290 RepID=UPI00263A0FED|nr:hypothetical protein [Microbacterium sp.]